MNKIYFQFIGTKRPVFINLSKFISKISYLIITFLLLSVNLSHGQIIAWQLHNNSGDETTVDATLLDSNLNISTLMRGDGLATHSLTDSYSSSNFTTGASKETATTNNDYIHFTINTKAGYYVSLSTLDAKFRRSSSGPDTYRWQYSTDGTNFTDIGSSDFSYTSTTTNGDTQSQIDFSGISELQNVSNTTTISIRLLAWGATSTRGTFALGKSTSNANDYSLSIGGTVTSTTLSTPPSLTTDISNNTVDNDIDISFTDDASWRGAVTAVKIDGTALDASDYVLTSGKLTLIPSNGNTLLTTAGSKSVTIVATGYYDASVTQDINVGTATKLNIETQPVAPTVNGSTFETQPVISIQDQYGNITSSNATVTASTSDGTWTLGGTTDNVASSGTATFTDLTATSSAAVSGASINFTCSGLTGVTSNTFDIPAPAPTIAVSSTSISGFTYGEGTGPSSEQTFTVSGMNLTGDISIAVPADYEISLTSGSGYTSPLVLSPTDGTVSVTTIYVRLKAGLQAGTYNNEDINATSNDATTKTITCSGKINTIYYSTESNDPTVLSSWNTNRDGTSGTSPSDFISGDIFAIQNGDSMTTSTTWNISGVNSKLWIEDGGTLTANDTISLSSNTTFQIDNGGKYIHNNTSPFASTIFNGTESFAANSTVEFRNWNSNGPNVASWGNVIFNATGDIASSIQLSGDITNISGNLNIVASGDSIIREVRLTSSSDLSLNIGGNLIVSGGILNCSSGNGNTTIHLSGDCNISDGKLTESGSGSGKIILDGNSTQNLSGGGEISNNITIESNNNSGVNVITNLSIPNLIIDSDATFSVNSGKQLTISDSYTNNGTLNLHSDATGTATILTPSTISGNGISNAEQYLSSARNWYISSPVTGATVPTGDTYYSYDEPSANWTENTAGTTLSVGTGYIAQPSSSTTLSFNGTLNTGDKNITLTRQGSNYSGYNLVGNPYPSYLDVRTAIQNNNNLEQTIWYRTRSTGSTPTYHFETVNATSGIGTNNAGTGKVTGLIPPMQAFWIKANTDGETLTFTNSMRVHAGNASTDEGYVPTTKLKVQAQTKIPLLRLQISNGENDDETIVYFNHKASNDFDKYDSEKRSNNNPSIPEIYTYPLNGNEKLVINGLQSDTSVNELALGFTTGKTGTFILKATQVNNFDTDTHIILKDNLLNTETELSIGSIYSFASDSTNTDSRFSIIFKTNNNTTEIDNTKETTNSFVFANGNHQIGIYSKKTSNYPMNVSIYNLMGQKIADKLLNSTYSYLSVPEAGIYLVNIEFNGLIETHKIIIK